MNILILNWRDPKNPKSGGAELVTMEHAKRWVKKGNTVVWFTARFDGSLKNESLEGITFVRRGNEYSVFIHAFIWYLMSKHRFDVVIDEIHGLPFFTPLYVRVPKIAFIHEVALEIWDYMYPFPINILGKLMEKLYFFLYRNIPFWTDAESVKEDLIRMGVRRCVAIPCPINNTPALSLPKKEAMSTFIFVGRVVKMKGIEDIIRSFKLIKLRQPQAQLWIIGSGESSYMVRIQEMVRKQRLVDGVKFYGRVSEEEKLRLMGKAHLLLHASIREGWGLVVLEAASQGTPTVAYNVTGLRDTVKDGETGVLTSRNTPEEMSACALRLLGNHKQYKKAQENGLRFVKSLSWEVEAEKSLSLLNDTYVQKN